MYTSADTVHRKSSILLSVSEVAELLGGKISTRSIWRWVNENKFPKPITIGGRTLWRRNDIELFAGKAGGSMKTFRRLQRDSQVENKGKS